LFNHRDPRTFKIDITTYTNHRVTHIAAVAYFEAGGPPSSPPITYQKQKTMLENKKMKTY
jgi:hypothetical protein